MMISVCLTNKFTIQVFRYLKTYFMMEEVKEQVLSTHLKSKTSHLTKRAILETALVFMPHSKTRSKAFYFSHDSFLQLHLACICPWSGRFTQEKSLESEPLQIVQFRYICIHYGIKAFGSLKFCKLTHIKRQDKSAMFIISTTRERIKKNNPGNKNGQFLKSLFVHKM